MIRQKAFFTLAAACVFGLGLLNFSPVFGQANAAFPKTIAGQRTEAYFKAFNSQAEQTMRAYFAENVDPQALERRPIDARMEFHKELWADMGRLEVKRIEVVNENEIRVEAKSEKGGYYKFDFIYGEKPPNKLQGFGVEQSEGTAEKPVPTKPLSESEAMKEIEKYLEDLAKKDEFSGTVLIARGGNPILQKAVGFASKEFETPNRIDTKFNLGSINKVFTQIAIAQLESKGKLAFDDTLGKHLPDYPNKDAAAKVTIKHLLTMTSGIGDFFNAKFEATPKDKIRNIKDYFQFFAADPLLFEPGAKRQYSNGGYVVLGAIIEKLSGIDYFTYVRKNIFEPAGMQNTDYYFADSPTRNMANGYALDSERKLRVNNFYTRPARGSSAGGGYSTALDMLKFGEALKKGTLKMAKLEANSGEKFGGLGIAGGAPGINSVFEIMPEKGFTVVVLSNYDPPSAESVGRFIASSLRRIPIASAGK